MTVTLDAIARAAAAQPAVTVGPDDFIYIKSEAENAEATQQRTFSSPWKLGPLTARGGGG